MFSIPEKPLPSRKRSSFSTRERYVGITDKPYRYPTFFPYRKEKKALQWLVGTRWLWEPNRNMPQGLPVVAGQDINLRDPGLGSVSKDLQHQAACLIMTVR
jgi:hypothetical protein